MFKQTYNFMSMNRHFIITDRDFHDLHVFGRPLLILEETNAEMYVLHLLTFYFSQAS